jgi:hypothetical protein
MSNMIVLFKDTSAILRLACLFRMANAVSSTIQLVNLVTSVSVDSFIFVIRAFASQCFPIELVPRSDGWGRTS